MPEPDRPGDRPGTRPDPEPRTPNDRNRPRTDDPDTSRTTTRHHTPETPTDRPTRDPGNPSGDPDPRDSYDDPHRHDPETSRDRDTGTRSPLDRSRSETDNTGDRDRTDRNPDTADRGPDEPERNSDEPTAHDRAEADRTAHEHARTAGPESDRTPAQKTCSTDPVDLGTGEFLLPETDFDLPGVLPLTLRRAHHSNYRFGRWFGPSWSSTLDIRLVVDDAGVTFLGEDGIMLAYPHAEVNVPVHPLTEGQLWSLTRTEAGGYRVHDRRRELIWHFAPESVLDGLDIRLGNYAVSAITDRHHNRIRFHYGADGAPIEISHSGGYRVRVDTHRGRVTTLSLVTGTEQAAAWRYTYTAGNLASATDPDGATMRYTYDAENRMTSWTDTNGNRMVNTYDEAGRVIRQRGTGGILDSDFAYLEFPDGTGRVTAVTDSTGAVTQHGFDRELQLRDLIDPAGGHTHIDYNADRRPLAITGPDGATTGYRYSESGNVASIVRPDGKAITAAYVFHNRPSTVTGADGTVTRREWSAEGNLSAVVDPAGNRTEFTYHANGALATVTEPSGARTTIQVDAAGLPIRITDPLGSVTVIRRDATGRPVEIIDPLGRHTHHEWSAHGKLLRQTDPEGHTESWSYDGEGNVLTHTDAAGAVTRYTYGDFDLLHSRTDPGGAVTRYTWDRERRLLAVANPLGQTWSYEYDPAGRLVTETDYAGIATRYTHDRAGRIETVIRATGTVHHRHDVLGRLTEISTDTGEWIHYRYDPAGRLLQAVNGIGADPAHILDCTYTSTGQLAAERLDDAEILYEHDRRGNRIRCTTPSGAVTTWRHDIANRVDQMTTDGRDLTFDYDPLGRLTSWQIGEIALTRQFGAAGYITEQEVTAFPARTLTLDPTPRPAPRRLRRDEFTYRPDGYLTEHTTIRATNPVTPATPTPETAAPDRDTGPTDFSESLLRRTYDLDPLGRITAIAHNGAITERYSYDHLGNITDARVPTEPPPSAHTNSAGPGRSRADTSPPPTREDRRNLLIRDGRTRYHYDAAGRLVRKTTTRLSRKPDVWRFRYNAFDQLTDVWTPDHEWWHYTYDPLGRRSTKQHLAADGTILERIDYIWDGAHLIEQTGTTSTVRWQYRPGSHTPLTQTIEQAGVDREFCAVVTDLVGAPAELIDPDTTDPAATAGADLWGRTSWRGKSSSLLRFPGQIYDPETGLHYNMFRYYNPDTGQYLTPDPLGLEPSPNPYAYTTNPLRFVDPLGLTPTACEMFDNFRRQVTPGELRGAPPPYPGGRPGHAQSKHGVSTQVQASILNSPDRIFSGTYRGKHHRTREPYTREVDIYYQAASPNDPTAGSVVITEAGNKNSVITAYGLIDKKADNPRPVSPELWADDPDYVEIRVNNDGSNEVEYTDRERFERNDWP
ncbi:RHS repeat-associated core domain-containing protein [Nocardia carnea]|uniref:RHS repeat-associated core domain-containing protein n=1 Tax=Nocardia carnea TaxID=37328 RepID=UPI002454AEE1|nr:RHS repeat-associated core domain-containing protein [Nocardia carnea]